MGEIVVPMELADAPPSTARRTRVASSTIYLSTYTIPMGGMD